ncbi:hypothetical protein IFR05_016425, partial [Cadophora sp. M221]
CSPDCALLPVHYYKIINASLGSERSQITHRDRLIISSEVEVYERVLDLATDRLGEVDVELFSLEPEADLPQENAPPKEANKAHEMRQALEHEKAMYGELRCNRKRRMAQTDSEDEGKASGGDGTCDEERLVQRAERQRDVIRQEEEL